MSAEKLAEALRDAQEQPFEDWWERDGQHIRAGGGEYEKTFAWNAWCAARSADQEQAGEAVAACYIRSGWIEQLQGGKDCVMAALARTPCNLFTVPLYTRPQQPLSDEQIAVLKFLDGSGLLRGAGYGCLPYGERRPFWWRRQLGDAFPQIRAHGITKDTSHNAEVSGCLRAPMPEDAPRTAAGSPLDRPVGPVAGA